MKILLAVLFILATTSVFAFRIPSPPLLTHPLNQNQINQLNDTLRNIWNLQNGEFNLDIVTTTKSNANNGDFWLIQTGAVVRMQFKALDRVFTIQDQEED